MPQISISVKNAQLVAKGLQDLSAEIPKISKDNIEKVFKRVVKQVQNYPPPRSGSRYIRTYTLRNSPRMTPTQSGFRLQINPIQRGRAYGRYVIGDARGGGQATVHIGRWLLLRDIVDFEMTKLPDTVYNHIRQFAKIKGLA